MKIAAYFNVNGIKISEPKEDKKEIKIIEWSKQDERFSNYLKELEIKRSEWINDYFCIPRSFNK